MVPAGLSGAGASWAHGGHLDPHRPRDPARPAARTARRRLRGTLSHVQLGAGSGPARRAAREAASTSPTRRWTGTPPDRCGTWSPCGSSTAGSRSTELTYAELRRASDAVAVGAAGARGRPGRPRVHAVAALARALPRPSSARSRPAPSTARSSRPSARSRCCERLALGTVRVLVTDRISYERKVAPFRDRLPAPGDGAPRRRRRGAGRRRPADARRAPRGRPARGRRWCEPATAALRPATASRSPRPVPTSRRCCTSPAARPASPRAPVHVHEAVVAHHATAGYALDLRPGDVYWCTADPGLGHRHVVRHHRRRSRRGVTVVTDAGRLRRPAVVPHPRRTSGSPSSTPRRPRCGCSCGPGPSSPTSTTFPALRHVVSVGEPLNPEAVVWGVEAFGLPVHDTWWQTETGAIMVEQLPRHADPPRVDGSARAGHRRQPSSSAGADGRAAVVDGHVRESSPAGRGGRAGAAAGLAVDVPRPTSTTPTATARASPTAGTSAATWPASTPTATSGSSGGPTTSSSPPGTSSAPSRSRAP